MAESKNKTKRKTYTDTIKRVDISLKNSFFLESSWIIYSLFEDRCNSILDKTGGMPKPKKNRYLSIDKKLNTLIKRSSIDPILKQINNVEIIFKEVKEWKNKRNPIMHKMVEFPTTWDEINKKAERLAVDGRKILAKLASIGMKVRKKYKKRKS